MFPKKALCVMALSGWLPVQAADFAIGVDASDLKKSAEVNGIVFRDNGVPKPFLQIYKDHGYDWVRLRLFNDPTNLPNNLAYTISLAQEAKKLNQKFLLCYHYSDTWADPGQQTTPKAWKWKNHKDLVKALFEYTRDTITAFREAGAMPEMVQIGNEVTTGMLWPDGRLPENWGNFTELLNAGIAGVEAGRGTNPAPRIMIQIDKGGDRSATQKFFDRLAEFDVKFDVIGQSYYPWWHGTLLDLRENLYFMATTYRKDIMLVEVGYPWEPSKAYRKRPTPFPQTPEGQAEFLHEVINIALMTPEQRCTGIFWWVPAVTNRVHVWGTFDHEGNALPVMSVFDRYTRGKPPKIIKSK